MGNLEFLQDGHCFEYLESLPEALGARLVQIDFSLSLALSHTHSLSVSLSFFLSLSPFLFVSLCFCFWVPMLFKVTQILTQLLSPERKLPATPAAE